MIGLFCDLRDFFWSSVSDGPSTESSLAKSASAWTASHYFDGDTFVDCLCKGYDRLKRNGGVFKVFGNSIFKACRQIRFCGQKRFYFFIFIFEFVKRGHIEPVEFFCCIEEKHFFCRACVFVLDYQVNQLRESIFCFAEYEDVDELGEWFTAVRHLSTCDYERVGVFSMGGPDVEVGQVEHVQDICVAELICEAKSDDVKAFQVGFRFESEQWYLFFS